MKIGLVGYGTGGRHFHAPFIDAAKGVSLAGVVARAPATIDKVKADYPNVPIYKSLSELIEAGNIDAVTISTPPATRKALVLEAISAKLHVIADKPFAPDQSGARLLADAAKDKGVTLGVFHNRRFDSDVVTLKHVLNEKKLGKIWRLHTRFDLDDPDTLELGPDGGLLRDLGSHMVDQTLYLLGPATMVFAQMDTVDTVEGRTNAGFNLVLRHENGARSHISASKLNHQVAKEFIVYGEKGSYVSQFTDVQANAIFAGERPIDTPESWGMEAPVRWPVLKTHAGLESVTCLPGRYQDYYEQFAQAVRHNTPPPVTPEEAIEVIKVLDAAMISAEKNCMVPVYR